MKLEVGMYVRYEYENVIYIGKINFISETMGFEEKLMFSVDNCIEEIYKENIIKASFNIIDLIEVGDYVNGSKVISIKTDENNIKWIYTNNENAYGYKNDEIRNIVTREQFEQMSYRLKN